MWNFFAKKQWHNMFAISLRSSSILGKGVFATKIFLPNEIIEEAPILLCNADEQKYLHDSALKYYYFLLKKNNHQIAIGLGLTSFYNHKHTHNASLTIDISKQTIFIKAIKQILVNEEITINYENMYKSGNRILFIANTPK